MTEVEWFVSILSPNDMKMIGRLIPGFPTDLVTPGRLREQLERALVLGYKKQGNKGTQRASINIRELYMKLGNDYVTRKPDLKQINLQATLFKLRTASRLRPMHAVGILYFLYGSEFDNILHLMMENTTNKVDFLEGIGTSGEMSEIEKIEIILGITQKSRISQVRELFENFAHTAKIEGAVPAVTNEHELLQALTTADRFDSLLLLVQFCLSQKDWEQNNIRPLLLYAETEYYSYLIENTKKSHQYEKSQTAILHQKEQQQWEEERNDLSKQINTLTKNMNQFEKTLIEKENELIDCQKKKEEELRPYTELLILIKEQLSVPLLFVAPNSEYLWAQLLQCEVLSKEQLLSMGKTKWKGYDNHVFFILRYAVDSTAEWRTLQTLLEANNIRYFELMDYNELDHFQQLISHIKFLREEIYDDELSYEYHN
ncbi:hypothetical protein MHI24_23620 [Paenibacillus sp. FSL K6-1096]|uniref:hypothetical protein n=1 Tax=Paenibacillus sp. FSL K6-1096 TaxID=2921460 RepID=UPI0030EC5A7E